jgi:hypothetical protein
MAEQIALERFTRELFNCLDETFDRHHGMFLDKGTSLFETLNSMTAADASKRAGANCATVAAHVEHVRFYLDVLEEIVRTENIIDVDWRNIWQTVSEVTPDDWEAQKQRLRDSYERVLNTIKTYDRWHNEYGVAGSFSVVAHCAYHLGAIRQAWCAIRSSKEI